MRYIQNVGEKHFCHPRISMIFLQNFLVTFKFFSYLQINLRPEMAL